MSYHHSGLTNGQLPMDWQTLAEADEDPLEEWPDAGRVLPDGHMDFAGDPEMAAYTYSVGPWRAQESQIDTTGEQFRVPRNVSEDAWTVRSPQVLAIRERPTTAQTIAGYQAMTAQTIARNQSIMAQTIAEDPSMAVQTTAGNGSMIPAAQEQRNMPTIVTSNFNAPWVPSQQLLGRAPTNSADHSTSSQPDYLSIQGFPTYDNSDYASWSQMHSHNAAQSNSFNHSFDNAGRRHVRRGSARYARSTRSSRSRRSTRSANSAPVYLHSAHHPPSPISRARYGRVEGQFVQRDVITPSTPASNLDSGISSDGSFISQSPSQVTDQHIVAETIAQAGAAFFDAPFGQGHRTVHDYPEVVDNEHLRLTESHGQGIAQNVNNDTSSDGRLRGRRETEWFGELSGLPIREMAKIQLKTQFDIVPGGWRCKHCFFETNDADRAANHSDREILTHLFNDASNDRYICKQDHRIHRDPTLFDKRSAIRHWQEVHLEERPYKCDDCVREFSKQDNLRRHQQSSHERQSASSQ